MAKVLYLNLNQESNRRENGSNNGYINPSALKVNRTLNETLVLPAAHKIEDDIAAERKSEPIKSLDDIEKACKYFLSKGKYRDYMLFILGINFGLRISDLKKLRFSNLINDNFTFKTTFPILEKKTMNTRKERHNRYITVNNAVVEAVTLYLQHNTCRLDDYMFTSESNNSGKEIKPLDTKSINRILADMAKEVGLPNKMSSHSLRKTFGYHQMVMSNNDPRKLLLLQKMFGHSTSAQTLDYIGFTDEEIRDAYLELNLGSESCYYVNSSIGENVV